MSRPPSRSAGCESGLPARNFGLQTSVATERLAEQLVSVDADPRAIAVANAEIDILFGEINEPVARIEHEIDARMKSPKLAEPRHQPERRKR